MCQASQMCGVPSPVLSKHVAPTFKALGDVIMYLSCHRDSRKYFLEQIKESVTRAVAMIWTLKTQVRTTTLLCNAM